MAHLKDVWPFQGAPIGYLYEKNELCIVHLLRSNIWRYWGHGESSLGKRQCVSWVEGDWVRTQRYIKGSMEKVWNSCSYSDSWNQYGEIFVMRTEELYFCSRRHGISNPALNRLCWVGESKHSIAPKHAHFGCWSNLSRQAVLLAAAFMICRNWRKYLLFHWWH